MEERKNRQQLLNKYCYLYETHLHTSRASACAHNAGSEMAKAAKEYGYAGIIITEHNWGGNTSVPFGLSWEDWIEHFITGYEEAYVYGQANDLDVFWGYEAGYCGTEFLIYGVTPQWLKEHPEIVDASIEEQYQIIHDAGGMVIHAHPFREEPYIPEIRLFPEHVDGVEGVNATHSNSKSKGHNDPVYDKRAIEYANQYQLPMTAGSDIHSTKLFGGGMLFSKRLRSIKDFMEEVRKGEYILTNGEEYYDRFGRVL